MKIISLGILFVIVLLTSCMERKKAANIDKNNLTKDTLIKFSYEYKDKGHENISLIVSNKSEATIYYSIGVSGLSDTGWIGLTADINSLGSNDFWGLTTILPGKKKVKLVSKKRIFHLYDYHNITEIRFALMYFEKKEISDNYKRIDLLPMKK